MVIRYLVFFALVKRSARLQSPRQLNVVTETFWSLARLKPIISLNEWRDLPLCGSTELRSNYRKLCMCQSARTPRWKGKPELTFSMRLVDSDGEMVIPVFVRAMVHTDDVQLDSCSGVGNAFLYPKKDR